MDFLVLHFLVLDFLLLDFLLLIPLSPSSGQKLNPTSDQSTNVPLVSFFKPFLIYVKSDSQAFNSLNGAQSQKGFQIQYTTIPCV